MSDTWSAEISYGPASQSPVSPTPPNTESDFEIGFVAIVLPPGEALPKFNRSGTDYGHFLIRMVGPAEGPFGQPFVQVLSRVGDPDINSFYWFSGPIEPGPPGTFLTGTVSQFQTGGTLRITKDDANAKYTVDTPFGSFDMPWTDFGIGLGYDYLNVAGYSLLPQGFGAYFAIPATTFGNPDYDVTVDVSFATILSKKNGTTTQTIALSALDPGQFYSTYFEKDNPLTTAVAHDNPPPWVLTQETSDFRLSGSQFTQGDFPTYINFQVHRRLLPPTTPGLEMVRAPEHGSLYTSLTYAADPTTIRFRKTYDVGASWLESTLYTDGSTPNAEVTLAWHAGRLYTLWRQSSGTLLQSVSSDLGAAWGTPVTLSITGTNPRLLVDPKHGIQYYFYVDGSSNLQLVRSGDFGNTFIDSSPHLVVATITPQTVAAEFAPDGSLIVGYIASGAWTQKRSKDLGLTWS